MTADTKMRRVPAEKAAILAANARLVAIGVGRSVTHDQIAQNVINSKQVLQRFVKKHQGPWIVGLTFPNPKDFALGRSGRLTKIELKRT